MQLTELFSRLKPFIVGLIAEAGGGAGPYAPAPHDLGGSHHSGTLTDSQYPNALLRDGSRSLLGDLLVADGKTLDGVDVSAFKNTFDAHAAASAQDAHAGGLGVHTHQSAGQGGQLDHGAALTGLGDDDHPHYLNLARHDTTSRHPLGTVVPHDALAQLTERSHTSLTGVLPDQHHSRDHNIVSTSDHIAVGSALDVVGLTGTNVLGLLTPSADVSAGRAALLRSTSAGGLTLAALILTGALDVGQDLTVGANVLFVDVSQAAVGINCAPDPQFALDVNGPCRAEVFVGPQAIQLSNVSILCHFDGPNPHRGDDYTGVATGHMGQVPTLTGATIFRPGKFYKAMQTGMGTTNYLYDPAGEYTNHWIPTGTTLSVHADSTCLNASRLRATPNGFNSDWSIVQFTPTELSLTAGQKWTGSMRIRASETMSATIELRRDLQVLASSTVNLTTDWQIFVITGTIDQDSTNSLGLTIDPSVAPDGQWFDVDWIQLEAGYAATPICVGNMGTGHLFTGAPGSARSQRSNAYVRYPDVEVPESGTLMGWFHNTIPLSKDGSYRDLFVLGGMSDGIRLFYTNTNLLYFVLDSVAVSFKILSNADFPAREWVHIAVKWDKATGVSKIIFNGKVMASGSYVPPADNGSGLSLGHTGNGGNLFTGWIDDVVLVEEALSDDRIASIVESGAPVFAETSTFSFRTPSPTPVWADEEGLWMRDSEGNAMLGAYGGNATKSWGGKSLESRDILIGRGTSYLLWDDSEAQVKVAGEVYIAGGDGIGNLTDAGALATQNAADWATQVTGSGKPADNATAGATWGVNLGSIPARFGDDDTPSAAGLYLTPTHLGYHNGNGATSGWQAYIQSDGQFHFGSATAYVDWDLSTLRVKGAINADSGYLDTLSLVGALTISSTGSLYVGTGTAASPTTGLKLFYNNGNPGLIGYNDGQLSIVLDSTSLDFYLETDELIGSVTCHTGEEETIDITSWRKGVRLYHQTGSTVLGQLSILDGEYVSGYNSHGEWYEKANIVQADTDAIVANDQYIYGGMIVNHRFINYLAPQTVDGCIGIRSRSTQPSPFSGSGEFPTYNSWGYLSIGAVYAYGGNIWVMNSNGTRTQISPHNFSLIPEGASEPLAWAHYTEKDGHAVNVDMMAVVRAVEALTGKQFIYVKELNNEA